MKTREELHRDAAHMIRLVNQVLDALDDMLAAFPACEVHEVGTAKDCARCCAHEVGLATVERVRSQL